MEQTQNESDFCSGDYDVELSPGHFKGIVRLSLRKGQGGGLEEPPLFFNPGFYQSMNME